MLAAQRGAERIAVEIKSFTSGSFLDDFHYAVGQYLNYRAVLALREPERVLYLAVPLDTYEAFFQAGIAAISVQTYAIKLLAYNPATQEVLQWIN